MTEHNVILLIQNAIVHCGSSSSMHVLLCVLCESVVIILNDCM